ncbi:hypothetical protein EOM81_01650 [bacterium]|nr:hypothetical protein [bacterium]
MPFIAESAVVAGSYRCSNCGKEGIFEEEGDELLGNSFTVLSFNCPECGMSLTNDDDLYNDDDELEDFKEEHKDEDDKDEDDKDEDDKDEDDKDEDDKDEDDEDED